MAMRTMTAATALVAAFAAVFLTAGTAMAKRDFSVRSEVRCDEAGTMCYDARSGAPFSGELRLYYPDGKVQASLFMPTDGRTANTASFCGRRFALFRRL